jgi:hypothetical protein
MLAAGRAQRLPLTLIHTSTLPNCCLRLSLLLPLTERLLAAGHAHRLKKFNGEDIDTISPTLGFNIKTLEHRGLQLNFWDVGGQKVRVVLQADSCRSEPR